MRNYSDKGESSTITLRQLLIDPRSETEAAPDDPIDLWYPIHEYQSGLSPYKNVSQPFHLSMIYRGIYRR